MLSDHVLFVAVHSCRRARNNTILLYLAIIRTRGWNYLNRSDITLSSETPNNNNITLLCNIVHSPEYYNNEL